MFQIGDDDEPGRPSFVTWGLIALDALALPIAEPTHYGLGKHGWVTFKPRRVSKALKQQFFDWILESYVAVAPAKLARSVK